MFWNLVVLVCMIVFYSLGMLIIDYLNLRLKYKRSKMAEMEYKNKIDVYEMQLKFKEDECKILRDRNTTLYDDVIKITKKLKQKQSEYKSDNTEYFSKDVINAVKYAVKHSHPDNGGNQNDFIKFKRVYDKLKGE